MILTKLPHAGMIVSGKSHHILFDPLLHNELISSAYTLNPKVQLNEAQFKKFDFSALFISHAHEDHLNLPSINLLNREITVYFPRGAIQIPNLLLRLGFRKFVQFQAGESFQFGELEVIPTPSLVDFEENGFIVKSKSASVWNLVDSVLNTSEVDKLLKRHGPPTLLLCYYQAIRENEICNKKIFSSSFESIANHYVNVAARTKARYVCPSSFDLFNAVSPWLNSYIGPVEKSDFIAQVCAKHPNSKPLTLNYGQSVDLSDASGCSILPRTYSPLEKLGLKESGFISKERSPLNDKRLPAKDAKGLNRIMQREFLEMLNASPQKALALYAFIKKMKWMIVVFNAKGCSIYRLHFSNGKFAWDTSATNPNFITYIPDFHLLEYLKGEISPLALYQCGLMTFDDLLNSSEKFFEPLTLLTASKLTTIRNQKIILTLSQ